MNGNDGFSAYQSHLQRGRVLRLHGRHAEAEKYFGLAIAAEPQNADGYYELALCYGEWAGHEKQALATIDHAIALRPDHSRFFSLRAWILGSLKKYQAAISVANEALALDPENIFALRARARAFTGLHAWKKAENDARLALSLQAHDQVAAHFLAVALRHQGRLRESNAVTAGLLAQIPEDPMAQSNAGWAALQIGDYRLANRHFLEALRLRPDYEYARLGLLHAFNSRVWIYRGYFRFLSWMGSHRRGMRLVIAGVIYLCWRLASHGLQANFGEQGESWMLVLTLLYFNMLGYGRYFANFFLLFDRFARQALTRKEKTWALLAAFAYFLGLGVEIFLQAWLQAAVLAILPVCFFWAALSPRLTDAWTSWRERQAGAAEEGSA